MKEIDQYHKWVEWSEEDQTYIGKCPDLITGIHGDDPVKLYGELCEVVEDVIRHFAAEGRTLPSPRIRPMQEVV
jgi:predicted RNase H-like HicB family nuclease